MFLVLKLVLGYREYKFPSALSLDCRWIRPLPPLHNNSPRVSQQSTEGSTRSELYLNSCALLFLTLSCSLMGYELFCRLAASILRAVLRWQQSTFSPQWKVWSHVIFMFIAHNHRRSTSATSLAPLYGLSVASMLTAVSCTYVRHAPRS
jgi:hypothetical protein